LLICPTDNRVPPSRTFKNILRQTHAIICRLIILQNTKRVCLSATNENPVMMESSGGRKVKTRLWGREQAHDVT